MQIKKRLDRALQEQFPQLSRNQIASFIMQGLVTVNGKPVTKPGVLVSGDAVLACAIDEPAFVCRAGHKLAHALDHFEVDVAGLVALDAGLSTGGFTDCLLQRGVARVYGVDVGYGQVHEKIRANPRVVVLERTNVRYLGPLPELVDLVTLDLSFISVLKVMPAVVRVMKEHAQLIVLIKPQFEAERFHVSRGGIVRDTRVHQQVIDAIASGIVSYGFEHKGTVESPLLGATGNREFLAYFVK